MKAIENSEKYFHVEQFIMLYKVVLIFTSVAEPLVCDYSNEKQLRSTSMWYCLLCCTKWF